MSDLRVATAQHVLRTDAGTDVLIAGGPPPLLVLAVDEGGLHVTGSMPKTEAATALRDAACGLEGRVIRLIMVADEAGEITIDSAHLDRAQVRACLFDAIKRIDNDEE